MIFFGLGDGMGKDGLGWAGWGCVLWLCDVYRTWRGGK